MKKITTLSLLILAIWIGLIITACNKQTGVTPPVKKTTSTPTKIYSNKAFLGTYYCVITGEIDMTCTQPSYSCYTGHRSINDTFVCIVRDKSLNTSLSYGNSAVVVDSILNNEVGFYLTSDTTFDANYLVYDMSKCKVGLSMSPDMGHGIIKKDTIDFNFNGNVHDFFHTVKSTINIKMIKQP